MYLKGKLTFLCINKQIAHGMTDRTDGEIGSAKNIQESQIKRVCAPACLKTELSAGQERQPPGGKLDEGPKAGGRCVSCPWWARGLGWCETRTSLPQEAKCSRIPLPDTRGACSLLGLWNGVPQSKCLPRFSVCLSLCSPSALGIPGCK